MDDLRFDSIARGLAQADWSRRRLVRILGGSFVALLGWEPDKASAKKRKKKKKKPPTCARDCTGKDCGDADGCGGKCTTQQGCGATETCISGQCFDDACDPPCTGNHICQNGSCACPQGLKECAGAGYFGNCHECCVDAFSGPPDAECIGNLGGEYCRDDDGDLIFRCSCYPYEKNCGDGQCVQCCTHEQCMQLYEDPFRVCVGGGCRCDEVGGFFLCPSGSYHERACRHISDDQEACGPDCDACGQTAVCAGGTCCLPPGASCDGNQGGCCAGIGGCGPGFICS